MAFPQCCFSREGEFFATCSSEGELKVWNSKTSSLHHTFVSSCIRDKVSCLSWSREEQTVKKRHHARHLYIGCGVGSKVIILNLTTNEESVLSCERSDVTSIDWDLGASRLIAGCQDGYVLEWDMSTAAVTRSWKADSRSVQSVCCYGDGTCLLTAGRAIKLWSLSDCSLTKKFRGHAAGVRRLCFLSEDSFISSAGNDRVLNYWQTSDSSAMAALTCEEEVLSFDCYVESGTVKVAVVSEEGSLYLYQFSLSPLSSSPISCTSIVQFVNSPPKVRVHKAIMTYNPPPPPHNHALTITGWQKTTCTTNGPT